MYEFNSNFSKFPGGYLFAVLHQKLDAYKKEHPKEKVISLGVGDVTLPLPKAVTDAMQKAVLEQTKKETFQGYGPYEGFEFLRKAIAEHDFAPYGVSIGLDEIFISDGAKSDVGSVCDLFSANNVIAVCDPTYPAYIDTNVIAGRCGTWQEEKGQWSDVVYLPCVKENEFTPELPERHADLIYLCFPNNPTGAMISKEKLQRWVDYANEEGSLILFDAAYEGFISDPALPHTIYECEGAKKCCMEFRSYSKTAGFTGVRLGYTVIPKKIENGGICLNDLWRRRLGSKYNGAPYIVQRGAEAIYTPQGQKEVKEHIGYYKENTLLILQELKKMGYEAFGGTDSPYIWMQTPHGMGSWEFFDYLLSHAQVVGTPGVGFGPSGAGYFRLTGFGTREETEEALERIRKL